MKKTFKITVKIDNRDTIFSEKLGPTVLATIEYVYDLEEKKYTYQTFLADLIDKANSFRDDLVSYEIEEVK